MSDLIWLSEVQMRRIDPYFPLSHGIPRVDDRRVLSGNVFVIRNGLWWPDALSAYGSPKTIYNRFIRWSWMGGDSQGSGDAQHRWKAIGGVFNRILAELTGKAGDPDAIMIDATHLKAHQTAASL